MTSELIDTFRHPLQTRLLAIRPWSARQSRLIPCCQDRPWTFHHIMLVSCDPAMTQLVSNASGGKVRILRMRYISTLALDTHVPCLTGLPAAPFFTRKFWKYFSNPYVCEYSFMFPSKWFSSYKVNKHFPISGRTAAFKVLSVRHNIHYRALWYAIMSRLAAKGFVWRQYSVM